jgi:hypothetical protein
LRVDEATRSVELAGVRALDPARQDAMLLCEVVESLRPLVRSRLSQAGLAAETDVVLTDVAAVLWRKVAVAGRADSRRLAGYANRVACVQTAEHTRTVFAARAAVLGPDLFTDPDVIDPLAALEAEDTARIVIRYVNAAVSPTCWAKVLEYVFNPLLPRPNDAVKQLRRTARVVVAAFTLAAAVPGLPPGEVVVRCRLVPAGASRAHVFEFQRLCALARRVYREQSPKW